MDANNDDEKEFTLYWRHGVTNTITSNKISTAIAKTLITDKQFKGIDVTLDFYEEGNNNRSWYWDSNSYQWQRTLK